MFCHSIRIAGAVADAVIPTNGDAMGDEGLSAVETRTLALNEPATGEDLLSEPASGTPRVLFGSADVRGPATSSRQEKKARKQKIARENLASEEELRIQRAWYEVSHNTNVPATCKTDWTNGLGNLALIRRRLPG